MTYLSPIPKGAFIDLVLEVETRLNSHAAPYFVMEIFELAPDGVDQDAEIPAGWMRSQLRQASDARLLEAAEYLGVNTEHLQLIELEDGPSLVDVAADDDPFVDFTRDHEGITPALPSVQETKAFVIETRKASQELREVSNSLNAQLDAGAENPDELATDIRVLDQGVAPSVDEITIALDEAVEDGPSRATADAVKAELSALGRLRRVLYDERAIHILDIVVGAGMAWLSRR